MFIWERHPAYAEIVAKKQHFPKMALARCRKTLKIKELGQILTKINALAGLQRLKSTHFPQTV